MQASDLKSAGEFANLDASGIYTITNTITKDVYVGSAVNFKKRWGWHIKDLKRNCHRNTYLQNAWNKYGKDAFLFEVLEYCKTQDLISSEQFWINTLDCVRPNGYNLAPIAGNCLGIKRSDASKEKMRQAKLGKKQSQETIAKRVAKLKGHKVSEAQRKATSLRSLGNTWGAGTKHSMETKAKISTTHKGRPKSEEHKRKLSEAAKRQFALIVTTPPLMPHEYK